MASGMHQLDHLLHLGQPFPVTIQALKRIRNTLTISLVKINMDGANKEDMSAAKARRAIAAINEHVGSIMQKNTMETIFQRK